MILGISVKNFLNKAQNEQWQIKSRYETLFKAIRDSIFINEYDQNNVFGNFLEVNDIAVNKFKFSKEQFQKMKFNDILIIDDLQKFNQNIKEKLEKNHYLIFEIELITKNNERIPVDLSSQVVNFEGKPLILSIVRDISDRKNSEEKIKYYAYHDFLTGLPNRALIIDHINHEIEHCKRNNTLMGILFLDLNNFKSINDTYGHDVGDQLLIEITNRLKTTIRKSDTIGRYGGDEFLILVPDLKSKGDLKRISNKIYKVIKEIEYIDDKKIYISTSIGIAIYPLDTEIANILVRYADIAMYRAKANKDKTYVLFDRKMFRENNEEMLIKISLSKALKNEQFKLFYQPIINLKTLDIIGYEALIRLMHPEFGLLMPDRFINLAERIGIIGKIDLWVLNKVCQMIVKYKNKLSPDFRFSVNISPQNLIDKNFPKMISNLITKNQITPVSIELELTENVFISDDDYIIRTLFMLKEKGIRIAIDDFGTGYSSFSYFIKIPVDGIKIDKTFLTKINQNDHNNKTKHLIQSIINVANTLKLEVTAEGIETLYQLEVLRKLNCTKGQGYYFSKPIPEDELEQFLKNFDKRYLSVNKDDGNAAVL